MSQSTKEMCERYNDLEWLKDRKTISQHFEHDELGEAIWDAGLNAEMETENPAQKHSEAWYVWQEGFEHSLAIHGKDYEEGESWT